MSWIRAEIWLGNPMKLLILPHKVYAALPFDLNALFADLIHYVPVLSQLLADAHLVPPATVVIGLRMCFDRDAMELLIMHPSFPRVESGALYPHEDVPPEAATAMVEAWANTTQFPPAPR